METPDFTGLHGKELTAAHRKWRKEQIKAGATDKEVRYAGLTREQAVEVYTSNARRAATSMLIVAIAISALNISWNIASNAIFGEEIHETSNTITHIISNWIFVAILIILGLHSLVSVRTPQSAYKAYIYSEDERVQEAQNKSGLFPITIISLLEIYTGTLLNIPTDPEITTPSIVGTTLLVIGIVQILLSLIVYFVLSKRN